MELLSEATFDAAKHIFMELIVEKLDRGTPDTRSNAMRRFHFTHFIFGGV